MTLKQVIAMTYTYYSRGQVAPDQLVEMYAGDLSDLDPAACCQAYERYRKNPKNKAFPLPAQIRELVNPKEFVSIEARAREIASRIVGAIPKFGWCNSKEAQVFIGPIGWALVQRSGGWSYLCERVGVSINPTTLQAQLRDQLEGVLQYGAPAVAQSIGVGAKEKTRELEPAGDIVKRLLERGQSNNDDGGAA